jgi:hypothetical protein
VSLSRKRETVSLFIDYRREEWRRSESDKIHTAARSRFLDHPALCGVAKLSNYFDLTLYSRSRRCSKSVSPNT